MARVEGSLPQRLGLALASYLAQDELRAEGMPALPVYGYTTRELTTVPAICVSVTDAAEHEVALPGSRQSRALIEIIHAVDDDEDSGLPEHRAAVAGVLWMLDAQRDAVMDYITDPESDDWQIHIYDLWLEGMPTETAERAVRTVVTLGVILHDLSETE